MLSFANPGKFLDDFDPERSTRELRKMQRKLKPKCPITKPSNTLYDETGCIRESGVDICDCLDIDCPGCHFPCSKCASEKCATECRCNRKWHFDNIYVEGTEVHIKMPMKINKVT
ncbi:hypothetical protein LOTGIDRAFT_102611 [Lottia gigantea]|uniref:ARF7 effector protein C-terminal domain-containing protein n=1 Tax=Lottia gigantea TaxID=225164 RepID=V4BHS1_LOTGI|nr:hypothetical protein LOTGIDRAFT_102611 [Lottia gigantea]ESP05402.1 hypothetical protein LOTGIDRAFT_102611 [Lottia gigantea]